MTDTQPIIDTAIASVAPFELDGDKAYSVVLPGSGDESAAPDAVLLCPESQAILVRTGESGL